ncbi:MAG TPA: aminomethyl-transferring glycine dehydrogenase subunit GcvPA [Anaerolineae bacterium]|nr:aminomethyl-transferring glycine dehydrogenase subunit GcvPA [Anaerolineae bacterium]HIQ05552.1 aminomethyl-transferring glycine dehydrogenase subunit GcvPA [Anaerolineae bacterium]
MTFIPNTDADRQAMLEVIGVERVEDLFRDVPEAYRFPKLELPPPVSEMEILHELQMLSEENMDVRHLACFLGAGAYHHFVPSVVDHVLRRSEFYTAYTPYQPEISQGTLQAMFEYQSMVVALTGMEVANASHYDGATSVAEAVIMALNVHRGKRRRIVMSPTVNPQYRAVARTYTQGMNLEIVGDDREENDFQGLIDLCSPETACVVVQNPDFLGSLHSPAEMRGLADRVHNIGALLVVATDPIALGLFTPPGHYGADIVTAEGQSLGNPLSFGGPYLGMFAMRKKHVHKSAGRIIGQTVDVDGKRGFVLTLSAREQHIRRGRATSNICSNQALNALAAAVYMAAMGKQGLRRVAELSYHKAHYAAQRIAELPGYEVIGDRPFFKEFVVRCPKPIPFINRYLFEEYGIIGGYDLEQDYPHLNGHMLLCVTEMNTRDEIDELVEGLREASERGETQEAAS